MGWFEAGKREERMERIKWIDRSRGLAILLVILGHIIGGLEVGIGGVMKILSDKSYTLFICR